MFNEKKTCQSIEDNMLTLSKFKCQIPILYHGHHLDDLIPKDVTKCSNEKTKGIYNRSTRIIHSYGYLLILVLPPQSLETMKVCKVALFMNMQ